MVELALFSGWLTPTSLFILLNIVIATILFVSAAGNRHSPGGDTPPSPSPSQAPHQFGRAPSFFSRVMSFNLSHYPDHHRLEPDEPEPEPEPAQPKPATPVVVARSVAPEGKMGNAELARVPSLLSRVASFTLPGLNREAQPYPSTAAQKETAQIGKKGNEEEKPREARAVEKKKKKKQQQPPRAVGKGTTSFKCDEEVDAKADDFINKFKQQLKLQRLESLLRYRNSAA